MSISATEQELALPQLIHVAGIPLNVAVFADAESRQQGLMDVTYLPEFSGGLFIYEQPATLSFWMKNTPIILEKLWVIILLL